MTELFETLGFLSPRSEEFRASVRSQFGVEFGEVESASEIAIADLSAISRDALPVSHNPRKCTQQFSHQGCGVRVEELVDPLMQRIRYLDKLSDELVKGKSMEKILRQ